MRGAPLSLRPFDPEDPSDCALLAGWNNEPSLKHLLNRFPTRESASTVFTPEHIQREGRALQRASAGAFLALVEGAPVGYGVFEIDPRKLWSVEAGTAWFALLLGAPASRGRGLGRRLQESLEARAVSAGATRAEVGVFEHNARALRFFERLGYVAFARRPDRTWRDGRPYGEVRLWKPLAR